MYRLLILSTIIAFQSGNLLKAPSASEISVTSEAPATSSSLLVASSATGKNRAKQSNYEIRWEGGKGKKITATYMIVPGLINHGQPSRDERIKISLPHSVKFRFGSDAYIRASGFSSPEVAFNIRIFRDGKECGKKDNVVSSTIAPSKAKTCSNF